MEKVYYLEFEVEEKIAIDESFKIRDFVFNKNKNYNYEKDYYPI